VPGPIAAYVREHDLELDSFPGAEAQVAALSDDIAYNNHDIDDGLRAGLFSVADLAGVPLVGPVFAKVAKKYPGLEEGRLIGESVRRLIDRMVNDLIATTRQRLEEAGVRSPDGVRRLGRPVVAFSEAMARNDRALKAFLFAHMYRHDRVKRMTERARQVVKDLFDLFHAGPDRLPEEWRRRAHGVSGAEAARLAADYIAGMTDRFALSEHARHFVSRFQEE
jgi:dGTPase